MRLLGAIVLNLLFLCHLFLFLTNRILSSFFKGGFIDASGYVKVTGVFTSSITGNLVVACAPVSSKGVLCRACVSIAFAAAAVVAAMLALNFKLVHVISLPYLALILFSLEFCMLATTWAVGLYLDDLISVSTNLDDWYVILVGCMMAVSMGFHNVAAKESIMGCPSTTVMTSTLINASCSLAKTLGLLTAYFNIIRLTPPNGPNRTYLPLIKEEKDSIGLKIYDEFLQSFPYMGPLISFLIGAIIGGISMKHGTFNCFIIPLVLLLIILGSVILKIYNDRIMTQIDCNMSDKMLREDKILNIEIGNKSPKYEISLSNLPSSHQQMSESHHLLQREHTAYL